MLNIFIRKKVCFCIVTAIILVNSAGLAVKDTKLPEGSKLLVIDNLQIHVNQRGNTKSNSAIVMLSGPTDHWHSDTGWFSYALPYLSQKKSLSQFQVLAIDRPGNGLVVPKQSISYTDFADVVHKVLKSLKIKRIVFLSFASSNITISHFLESYGKELAIDGIVLVDPDVMTEFSRSRYRKDAKPFKDNLSKYLSYIGEGKYQNRVKEIVTKERTHIQEVVKQSKLLGMDWAYFEFMLSQRSTKEGQTEKFKQIVFYHDELAKKQKMSLRKTLKQSSLLLVLINTNFESSYLPSIKDPLLKKEIIKWQKDGDEYYKMLTTQNTKGKLINIDSEEHLLPLFSPQILDQAFSYITNQN